MKLIVPVDGSKYSLEALKVAADIAKAKDAKICLIHVVPFFDDVDLEISAGERQRLKDSLEKRANTVIEQSCHSLVNKDIISTCRAVVSSISVPDAIIDYAESEKADLIVIGSRGLSKSSRFKLGSVTARVVKHSPCSVYVVKMS